MSDDAPSQLHEYRDPAAPRPGDPPVQGLLAFFTFDREHMPQTLFEQVSTVEPGIGFGDPGQLGALAVAEILRVLPQRVPGALKLAGPLMTRPRRSILGGAAAPPCGLGARDRPRIVPGPSPLGIQRLGGPG